VAVAQVVLISTPVALELLAPVAAPHSTVGATQIYPLALEVLVVPTPVVVAVVVVELRGDLQQEPRADQALS
jgi:hypothetical protein